MYQTLSIQEKTSDTEMKCNAVEFFFDYMRVAPKEQTSKHVFKLMEFKLTKIKTGDTYFDIEVLDDETGELLEYKCLKVIHNYCIKHNLYPKYLMKLFNQC